MIEPDPEPGSADGLGNLLPWERRFAANRLPRWRRQQAAANPEDSAQVVLRKALKMTYTNVAGLWLSLAGIPTFAAACLWSLHDSLMVVTTAWVLTVVSAITLSVLATRMAQAHRYWPERIVVRRRDLRLTPAAEPGAESTDPRLEDLDDDDRR
jgi:hypothetical protein